MPAKNENLTQRERLGGAYTPRLEVEQPRDGVDGILLSETLAAEGEVVFAKACQLGLEGTSYRVFLCLAAPQGRLGFLRTGGQWPQARLEKFDRHYPRVPRNSVSDTLAAEARPRLP